MNWHFYTLSGIFIIAGILHIIRPRAFMRVMPLYIPYHKPLVYISGMAEIIAGSGMLFSPVKVFALWSIITMLVLFFPVHIHMLAHKKAGLGLPKSILLFRLVLQFFLIYWSYSYL
ncbi:hypothetical protein [Aquimarina sp. RZ0]|uniref:DoxX family protein n=1 Tax=Aquimarina sp. RZ0 TaxID=2607730 RepID=UPI0011F38BC8|nr:hypothetical protein [Aquimarina sp. RZ0]KAA1242821.1 hypothetical protein F0000_23930 [Aquimarina sp. RZ0]